MGGMTRHARIGQPPIVCNPQVVQEPGEILFAPPYWHHQVENLTPALSINHNWLNAAGLHWSWGQLRAVQRECAAQIADCRPLCSPAEFEASAVLSCMHTCSLPACRVR